jgi:glucosylglycerol-phosphate synthase
LTNPHDIKDLTDTLMQGITISRPEAEARMRQLFEVVQHNDIHRWGREFLDAVAQVTATQRKAEVLAA